MKYVAVAASAACIAVTAVAQTGTYTWQLSADIGATWTNALVANFGTPARVRLLASWSGITGTRQGFAGAQFDAVLWGAGSESTVSDIVRPVPYAFAFQQLTASSIDGGQKIDAAANLAAPGSGSGWVNPGQPGIGFSVPDGYSTAHPAIILTFDVILNDLIEFNMVLNQRTGRAMAVYPDGLNQIRISASEVTVIPATFIPTAAPVSLLMFYAVPALRRLRSCKL